MAVLALVVLLILAMAGHSGGTWCICKGLSDTQLQRTLDYACGAGADCGPVHPNGACYQPNTVRAHCSYAVNSYFQKKGQVQGSCDFAGTASLSISDPSVTGCVYPSSASGAGTGTTNAPITTSPSTTTTPPKTTTTTPYTTTTPTGVLGGNIPPGDAGITTDAGFKLLHTSFFSLITTLLFSGFSLWGG